MHNVSSKATDGNALRTDERKQGRRNGDVFLNNKDG